MFVASTAALGCSFFRIFRVQQETTFVHTGNRIPDKAVYLAAFAMAIGTGSIAVSSACLVEQGKKAINYTEFGIGVFAGFYTIFVFAWLLPGNTRMEKLTLSSIIKGLMTTT